MLILLCPIMPVRNHSAEMYEMTFIFNMISLAKGHQKK